MFVVCVHFTLAHSPYVFVERLSLTLIVKDRFLYRRLFSLSKIWIRFFTLPVVQIRTDPGLQHCFFQEKNCVKEFFLAPPFLRVMWRYFPNKRKLLHFLLLDPLPFSLLYSNFPSFYILFPYLP